MATARTTHRLHGATPPSLEEARSWIGSRVTDSLGSGLGRLEDVRAGGSGRPEWLLIREGRFGGGKHRLVPFEGATAGGGQVWLPHERDVVRSSPVIARSEALTDGLFERLRAHYGG
ncbi:MAG: PRC-barrel domain-containing protein [Solirubrobacterales bacterium]|nr:PRC-barrel domain-containing protein [Solirubrobacterales bacterium]